ncbi:transmembrane protein, putative (macronuclear) [Tetrahymena thermophila SB210]|uniref:Transmembrane protein, putative n=1 Tax=Tetrahymena thermophila (strain SB210) TaxID=312017 RepID=I7MKK0_TETTS|nr:transmembrane protein, putative [Tetrahymena thermophila SB210]EAR99416.1 transmembrane protein, putative [Tetrahymena thermophila SB210]|eukprot:XP_001019661.1 transmembrane protein, putative [Tetrahymena thermophila SB210]
MNFHAFVQSTKNIEEKKKIDLNLDGRYYDSGEILQVTSTSFLIYITSFTIRSLFIKKFSPAFSLKSWDLILPLWYLKVQSKKYKQSYEKDEFKSKIDQIMDGKIEEQQKNEFLRKYNMQYWTNSQYWH